MSEVKPCPYCGCQKVEVFPTFASGFFAVRCYACHIYGPHSEKEDCAIERWNALPRRLRWTREKPTKEGWYWHHVPPAFGTVIEYYDPEIAGTETTGEWAGPIPEPE